VPPEIEEAFGYCGFPFKTLRDSVGNHVTVAFEPLGLVGFGLFLVFGYLSKVTRPNERRWLSPVEMAFAGIALVGGLTLEYFHSPNSSPTLTAPASSPPPPTQELTNQVRQSSTEPGSPNVQGLDQH
jgi:hypothetical protein